MGDQGGGMDPCECIFSHELAMRRLINLLRNSQAYCTDTECFEDGTSFRGQTNPTDNVLLMTIFFMAALLLYYFRPRAQRIDDTPNKPNFNGNGNGAPPTPPSTT